MVVRPCLDRLLLPPPPLPAPRPWSGLPSAPDDCSEPGSTDQPSPPAEAPPPAPPLSHRTIEPSWTLHSLSDPRLSIRLTLVHADQSPPDGSGQGHHDFSIDASALTVMPPAAHYSLGSQRAGRRPCPSPHQREPHHLLPALHALGALLLSPWLTHAGPAPSLGTSPSFQPLQGRLLCLGRCGLPRSEGMQEHTVDWLRVRPGWLYSPEHTGHGSGPGQVARPPCCDDRGCAAVQDPGQLCRVRPSPDGHAPLQVPGCDHLGAL